MKKVTKTELVRRYATKHPYMTVRQMASDLDMSPASVHQIMWGLRKKGMLGNTKTTAPFAPAPVKNEGTIIENTGERIAKQMYELQMKVEEQRIIIKYLERRVAEATNERG